MAWEWQLTFNATSPRGQRVEYWQRPGNGYSVAESPAKVVVSGKAVLRGWSCDGKTYAEYNRIAQEGYTAPE